MDSPSIFNDGKANDQLIYVGSGDAIMAHTAREKWMRNILIVTMILATMACTSSTPKGTVLLTKDLDKVSGVETTHRTTVILGDTDPSSIAFEIHTANAQGAGHITKIVATVVDAGGWELSFVSAGQPINRGTLEAPSMSLSVLIQQTRDNACGTQLAQHMIEIHADGTAKVQESGK